MLKIATVCTGIGSPEQALKQLGIPHKIVFGCEIDKYARQTYLANFGDVKMYEDMTKEEWINPEDYADLFISGIPCQSFSLAGKRLGELDPRGLLFFDFYRYVKNQRPKYFIIENVKGLLSDNDGNTFRNWINLLGQSENGNGFFFPHEDSLMYNLHWTVLNSKDFGVPQNRERVFLVGLRNDLPNDFVFPKGIPLTKRLKDVLEYEVDEKYFLSDTAIKGFINHAERHAEKGNGFKFSPTDGEGIAVTLTTHEGSRGYNNFLKVENIGNTNPSGNGMNGNVFSENGISPTLTTNKGEGIKVQIPSATASGYEIATEGDSINLEHPNSKTRRGRVGVGVAQTLTTSCNQAVYIGAIRGRNPDKPNDRTTGAELQQTLEINQNGTSNCLTSVQKDNVVVYGNLKGGKWDKTHEQSGRVYNPLGIAPTIHTMQGGNQEPKIINQYRIRKLTPKECFRLQGFPDEFHDKAVKSGVSSSQLYKQAGNSITVNVMQSILKNLLKNDLP